MSRTILCVEDEQDTSALLKAILEREGYVVVRAVNGRQAICLIETMLPPALILLDVILPYVNGFELLAALRLNPDWKHVPIIMVSADSCGADIERAPALGANDYMVKTTGIKDLVQKVTRVLSPSTDEDRKTGTGDRVCPATVTPVARRPKARARRAAPTNDRKGGAK